ncbi:hypothetical protein [Myceligenerans salitolerans]|uniref:Acyl-CoA dehydrogenase n=1 Tax=Myceligenerans salitolerans TaxID=1230528 RepID=A0ABS3IAS4_9MICO|nr:hypothetical protein [Myceligenerans salitolerans]MBO0609538.1 hypothetical protein [Myceligenerans salitolerans]
MDGGEPLMALTAARRLVEVAVDQAAAAQRVEWESPAATRFRVEAAQQTHALVGQLDLLDEAVRLLRGLS